jgi:flagellin
VIKFGANILSQTVQRNLGRATLDLSTTSERLASGHRINKASDDAAGLAIASKLTTDRRLNQQAVRNINDGISMVNIVSSALDSQKGIIERMSELAAQGANSTYTAQQRQGVQREYLALLDEFDRIGSTTEFNGVKLLRNQTPQSISLMTGITGDAGSLIELAAANSHRYAGVVAQRSNWNIDAFILANDVTRQLDLLKGVEVSDGSSLLPPADQVPGYASLFTTDSAGRSIQVNLLISRVQGDLGAATSVTSNFNSQTLRAYATASDGENIAAVQTISSGGNPIPSSSDFSFSFASGATVTLALDLSGITFSSYDVNRTNTQPSAIGFTNVLNEYNSRRALPVLSNRLNELSLIQSQFGAVQSRLTTAYNLRSSQNEVLAAATSRIMDADMASESAEYVRTSILQQNGAALLARANQQPALALKLLT